jgi:hypothetical protein
MQAMEATRSTPPRSAETELHQCRVRLAAGLTAPGLVRERVREAILGWGVPADLDIAVLLASDLVTHVISQEAGESVTVAIRCSESRLRIEVHDSSRARLGSADAPAAGATAGGILTLVGTLSTEWGSYRTPAGMAWFFTLAFRPHLAEGTGREPQGIPSGDGE